MLMREKGKGRGGKFEYGKAVRGRDAMLKREVKGKMEGKSEKLG